MQKEFSTAAVLAAYTGFSFWDADAKAKGEHFIKAVYDVLNFMTDDNLGTIQLPRAANEVHPYLAEQFPWLPERFTDDDFYIPHTGNGATADRIPLYGHLETILQVTEKAFGKRLMVRPMHGEDHERISHEDEAALIVGEDKVLKFNLDDFDLDDNDSE